MTKDIWLKRHPLAAYFLLAYAVSWFFMIPLALTKQGLIDWPLPFSTHYLAAYGPFIAAFLVTFITSGKSGVKNLFKSIVKWNVKPVWWIVVISPILIYAILSVLNYFLEGSFYNQNLLGEIKYVPNWGIGAVLFWILTYGLGEEVGWRGFALPRLQTSRNALSATVFLWIFWSLWHLPAFFYLYDTSILIPFLIGQFSGAILFTWLFNSTSGSTLMVIIFHGTFNFITASKGGEGLVAAVLSTLVIVWAVLLIILYKPASLSHLEHRVTAE